MSANALNFLALQANTGLTPCLNPGGCASVLLAHRPQTTVPQVGHLVCDQAPDGTVRQWYTVVAVEWPLDMQATQAWYSLTDEAQVIVRVRLVQGEENAGA